MFKRVLEFLLTIYIGSRGISEFSSENIHSPSNKSISPLFDTLIISACYDKHVHVEPINFLELPITKRENYFTKKLS